MFDLIAIYFIQLTTGRAEDRVKFISHVFKTCWHQIRHRVCMSEYDPSEAIVIAGELVAIFQSSSHALPEWLVKPVEELYSKNKVEVDAEFIGNLPNTVDPIPGIDTPLPDVDSKLLDPYTETTASD